MLIISRQRYASLSSPKGFVDITTYWKVYMQITDI